MWPLEVGIGTLNPRFVELGLGTCNPRFVAWPLELGLGTRNPRFVVWPFEWCQEVDVEEVLTATLRNKPVSSDKELDVLSNPLMASPPDKEVKKKEVQPCDSEVDLFAPSPTAPAPKQKVKGKKALPSAPPPPKVKGKKALPTASPKVKGKKALPSAPLVDARTSKRCTQSTIPSETAPLGVGDWLTDKDIVCWLNQEVRHNEIDEPRAWTLALLYIKRLPRCMQRVESGTRLDNVTWCCRHIFVVNSNNKEGLHWFVCAFDCRVWLELFTIWVWEPLSCTPLIRPFLMATMKLSRTTKHRALGFQTDGWFGGFQSLNIAKLVVEHRGTFSDVPLVLVGAGFVDYVLSIVNADRVVWVIEAPSDDVEGVPELLGPLESPPPLAPKLKVHFRLSRRVLRPPPPHSKARRPPPSRAWKARRPGRNLPWPLPQRSTPFPRSSSVESGARCRMATQQMHLASRSVTFHE